MVRMKRKEIEHAGDHIALLVYMLEREIREQILGTKLLVVQMLEKKRSREKKQEEEDSLIK